MSLQMSELKNLKVLIVDDDADLAGTLRDQLEAAGMNIVGVSGECGEAIRLVEETNPDLIIMDIRLPEVDGIELAKKIMLEEPRPILFLSAYSDNNYIRRVKEMGAMTYLVKPVDLDRILPSIVLTMERFREMTALRATVDAMEEERENHRVIDRAKEFLRKHHGITDQEAYDLMRKKCQAENRPIAEIARAVMVTLEML